MGADLYIKSLSSKCREQWEPEFNKAVRARDSKHRHSPEAEKLQEEVTKFYDLMESQGYFRDSYNPTAIMGRLGLSWWKDVIPMLNAKGELTPTKAKKLLEMIKESNVQVVDRRWLVDNHCTVDETGENSVDGWNRHYQEKKVSLEKFLQDAIDLKENIMASL